MAKATMSWFLYKPGQIKNKALHIFASLKTLYLLISLVKKRKNLTFVSYKRAFLLAIALTLPSIFIFGHPK